MHRALWLLVLLFLAGHALAFSGEGHQIIGTIAAEKLKGTRAEREIAALLADKSLAEVSTWADRLKRKAFDEESAAIRAPPVREIGQRKPTLPPSGRPRA